MSKLLLCFSLFILMSSQAFAKEITLLIQPILDAKRTMALYKPLADYLSKQINQDVKIVTTDNFLAYWNLMRQSKHDLVLDAAHFTDFRAKKYKYEILCKIKDTITYSLITNEKDVLFDAQELIAKPIATVTSPSLGGIRLAALFDNPARQPKIVNTATFNEALAKLKSNEAFAAMVPTPMINGDLTVNTVFVTEPVPHMAVSASPDLPVSIKRAVKQALLNVKNLPGGEAMRKSMNISGFEPVEASTYDGYDKLLKGVWGYSYTSSSW